jgi:glycosyltransferase involved in cell wall biosynthesis
VNREACLYVTPEAPYPLHGGGALRSASLLDYLSRRYAVDVLLFRQPGESVVLPDGLARNIFALDLPAHARHLPARFWRNTLRLARGVPPLIDRFSGFGDRIAQLIAGRSYEVGVIEHFWCAPYWEQVSAVARRTVLDLHNIESVLHERCGAAEPWPVSALHRRFSAASRRMELLWWPRYSQVLVTSEPDAELVRKSCPHLRPTVYPNALPVLPPPSRQERDLVVFTGNLEYHPNVSAVRWFRREIWPIVRREWPVTWRLVGKNPAAVRKYTTGDARIETSGPVPDAIAELAAAKVAVVPLLAGSGTRLKILEAWAAACPVVSTPLGAEGLPARDGENILLASDAPAFAAAISRLLASADLRRCIGAAGRAVYAREYTWEAAARRLDL